MVHEGTVSLSPEPINVLLAEAGASAGPRPLGFLSFSENPPFDSKFTNPKIVETDQYINQLLHISNSWHRIPDQYLKQDHRTVIPEANSRWITPVLRNASNERMELNTLVFRSKFSTCSHFID